MTSQQICYFISAAEHLSFTKAAEEFFTSQPTISRQVAALEDELGFKLFYRDGKQLRLTSGGLVMLAEFSNQQKSLKDAVQRVSRIQNGMDGTLSVGFLSSFDTDVYVYPPSMAFSERYPNISITMDGASFAPLRQRLYDGEYDVIFTYSFDLPFMRDVLSQQVYKTGCSLVSSSGHPLARLDTISPSDLIGQTLILPFSAHMDGWQASISAMFTRGLGLTAEEYRTFRIQVVDTLETKQFLVRSGAGIGITGNCASYAYDSRYALFPIPGETLQIHAVWRKDNLNPVIPLFLQVLAEAPEIDVF